MAIGTLRRASTLGAALVAATLGACAPAWPAPNPATWPGFVSSLEQERARRPATPWAATLAFRVFDSQSGRTLEGRGGIAVAPGSAVRMILVGGAGTTVLDAWITSDRWRVAIPPARRVERGGSRSPIDLPVGFLRWWFVAPLSGALVAATNTASGPAWLLSDGPATMELRSSTCGPDHAGHRTEATRRQPGRKERVVECRTSSAPSPGDHAGYVDLTNGLQVDVTIEAIASAPPDPDAFRDPEETGAGATRGSAPP
jgi:hypothetical protein